MMGKKKSPDADCVAHVGNKIYTGYAAYKKRAGSNRVLPVQALLPDSQG